MPKRFYRDSVNWKGLWQKTKEHQNEARTKRYEAAENTNVEKIILAIDGLGEKIICAADQDGADSRRKSGWDKAEVFGLWAAAIVGAFAIIVSSFDSGNQQRLANAANATTREAFTAVQRAFIVASRLEITPQRDTGGMIISYNIRPIIRNSGYTPTRNFELISSEENIAGNQVELAGLQDPGQPFDKPYRFRSVIGPGDEADIDMSKIQVKDLRNLVPGDIVRVFSGAAHYEDIFGDSPAHITKYCFIVVLQVGATDKSQFDTRRCPNWNCADDECK
jgi:hypothetical protein